MRQESGTEAERLAYDTTGLPVLSTWEVTSGSGQGNKYTWGGSAWVQTHSGGAALVSDFDSQPGTVYEHTFVNVPNYTGHGSGTGVLTAEVVGVSMPAGVRAVRISAMSGPDAGVGTDFAGCYVVFNNTDVAVAASQLSHGTGTTVGTTAGGVRKFVPAGESRVFYSDVDITSVHVVALDLEATPANTIVVEGKVND